MEKATFKRADWIANTNIYEVNIRQYTPEGSFNAFARSLPRLKDMGVEVLWLMPIHPIGKINRKGTLGSYYSVADFTGVNPEFGTVEDFKNLVNEIHASGMKIIMDWVANHAAWDNVWTKDHPEYFVKDDAGNFKSPYDWTDVIQIDHSNTAQQDAMIEAMKYWVINFDIDGFRADLAHLTPLAFWKKARTGIELLKPGLFWLAESEEIDYHEVFDASFTWEWMHATENFHKGDLKIEELVSVLTKYQTQFPASAYRMYFTSNHDENTWNGTAFEKYGDMLKPLAVFNCTWDGIPMIYSGEELPNLKRLQFFEKDSIEWTDENKMHAFYKTLLSLKKRSKALEAAHPAVTTYYILQNENVLGYLRRHEKAAVLVLLNLCNSRSTVTIGNNQVNGNFVNVFDNTSCQLNKDSILNMDPWAYFVFETTA